MTGVYLCCSPIRQIEMFCFHGVLVSPGVFHIYYANELHILFTTLIHTYMYHLSAFTWSYTFLPGEDMTAEGRRQLALFLVRRSFVIIIHALRFSVNSCFSCLV